MDKIKMVDRFSDLSIGKYNELMALRDARCDETELTAKMLAVLSDMDEDEVMSLPLPKFKEMAVRMMFLKDKPRVMKILPRKVTINGKRYTIAKDAFNLTAGQYIDYKEILKDIDHFYENLPRMMTVFLIPEGCKYLEGYDGAELADEFREHLSIELAISVSNFFFLMFVASTKRILRSLDKAMKTRGLTERETAMMAKAKAQMDSLRDSLNDGFGLIGA